jgi:uncharacterized protein YjdB
MAYENSAGLNIHNQYGPRTVGGSQGVYKTEGFKNQYVIDQESQGLEYLFPRGGGVFVTGYDDTYATGTVTSITIGDLEVIGATEDAPIHIPYTNTGEVVQTGMTAGRLEIYFKKAAGYEEDTLPAFPSDYADIKTLSITPATVTLSLAGTNTQQLTVAVTPTGADSDVIYTSSDATKATVSSSGLVTGVAAGSATITAKSVADNSLTDTCVVTVTA